jgi:hypothetical protein
MDQENKNPLPLNRGVPISSKAVYNKLMKLLQNCKSFGEQEDY